VLVADGRPASGPLDKSWLELFLEQPINVEPIQNAEITISALRIENPPSGKKIEITLNGAKKGHADGRRVMQSICLR
jgi:hypothetical protein